MMYKLEISYTGPVVPKPRMTRRDKWLSPPRPCVARYRDFKSGFMAQALEQGYRPGQMDIIKLEVLAMLPMAKSWSKKKRKAHQSLPHRQKPDADNILKAVGDTLAGDDSGIYSVSCRKFWSSDSYLNVTIHYLAGVL